MVQLALHKCQICQFCDAECFHLLWPSHQCAICRILSVCQSMRMNNFSPKQQSMARGLCGRTGQPPLIQKLLAKLGHTQEGQILRWYLLISTWHSMAVHWTLEPLCKWWAVFCCRRIKLAHQGLSGPMVAPVLCFSSCWPMTVTLHCRSRLFASGKQSFAAAGWSMSVTGAV